MRSPWVGWPVGVATVAAVAAVEGAAGVSGCVCSERAACAAGAEADAGDADAGDAGAEGGCCAGEAVSLPGHRHHHAIRMANAAALDAMRTERETRRFMCGG
jgi:hypothetical protein